MRRTSHWLNSSHIIVSSTPRHERLAWLAHTWNLKHDYWLSSLLLFVTISQSLYGLQWLA
jgi:hypothetical protein